MKISPEPLYPMRAWRELWQAEPLPFDRTMRKQELAISTGKHAKRTSFHWLSSLLNRESDR